MKSREYPEAASTTKSERTFKKEILAAAKRSAAAEVRIGDELAELAGGVTTRQERTDFHELVALLQSLDGPEALLRTQGYSRAIFPGRDSSVDVAED
jgi:hypothetical protein